MVIGLAQSYGCQEILSFFSSEPTFDYLAMRILDFGKYEGKSVYSLCCGLPKKGYERMIANYLQALIEFLIFDEKLEYEKYLTPHYWWTKKGFSDDKYFRKLGKNSTQILVNDRYILIKAKSLMNEALITDCILELLDLSYETLTPVYPEGKEKSTLYDPRCLEMVPDHDYLKWLIRDVRKFAADPDLFDNDDNAVPYFEVNKLSSFAATRIYAGLISYEPIIKSNKAVVDKAIYDMNKAKYERLKPFNLHW